MTKSIEAVRQDNGLWTVNTIETTVEKDVVCTIKDKIVPPPVVTPPTTNVLFYDDFSSMDLKKSMNGIFWSSSNAGSGDKLPVITRECLYRGKPSLKFTFGGGPLTDAAWCEQRLKLPNLAEFWMQFYRYYPNGIESPSLGPKWVHRKGIIGENNKFVVFWSGPYQGYGTTIGISTWANSGRDVFYPTIGSNQGLEAGQHGLPSVAPQDDSTLGRWVKINIHCKTATAMNNDGILQMWEDDVIKMDNKALPIYPKDGLLNAFTEGYLMGYANSGFDQTTYCYWADVKISD